MASPRKDPPHPASSIASQITITASLSIINASQSGFIVADAAGSISQDREQASRWKALAFRDAGKMAEAREWAAELVRLLKSHNLLA